MSLNGKIICNCQVDLELGRPPVTPNRVPNNFLVGTASVKISPSRKGVFSVSDKGTRLCPPRSMMVRVLGTIILSTE